MNMFKALFQKKKVFVGYITAGHRGLDYTYEAACSLVAGGVDILEIGVPFSDPIADGSTIQAAMTDALSRDFKLDDLFESIHKIKMATQVPIVLFSYLNPMLHNGLRKNLKQAKKNGVDGLLLIDMPLEESQEYFAICKEIGLEPVGLLSPTTPLHRVQLIDSHCQSFLYYVCRNGVTGVKSSLPRGFQETMDAFQGVSQAPIVCGFGIGDRVLAKEALEHAAGFVVGSAFVSAISEGATPTDLSFLAQEIDPR